MTTGRVRRPPLPVESTRITNLSYLIDRHGGYVTIADRVGWANKTFVSQLMTRRSTFSEGTARKIEMAMDLPPGWMDEDHGFETDERGRVVVPRAARPRRTASDEGHAPAGGRPAVVDTSASIDTSVYKSVLQAIAGAASDMGVAISPGEYSEIASLALDNSMLRGGDVDHEFIRTMIRLLGKATA